MVPVAYVGYFTSSASAGAAMIGLLFVAISLRPDSIFGDDASASGRALAGSAFTGLVNAFFVSLIAAIPKSNVGIVTIIASLASLAITIRLHQRLSHRESHVVLLTLSLVAFAVQLAVGIALVLSPHDRSLVTSLCYLIACSFAASLARAWALMRGKHLMTMEKTARVDSAS